jgi:hypothetical protein
MPRSERSECGGWQDVSWRRQGRGLNNECDKRLRHHYPHRYGVRGGHFILNCPCRCGRRSHFGNGPVVFPQVIAFNRLEMATGMADHPGLPQGFF